MSDEIKKHPRIIIKDGNPYVVKNLGILEDSKGSRLELKPGNDSIQMRSFKESSILRRVSYNKFTSGGKN